MVCTRGVSEIQRKGQIGVTFGEGLGRLLPTTPGGSVERSILETKDFPGWMRYSEFLCGYLAEGEDLAVLDLGGGANPILGDAGLKNLTYDLLDIDATELQKAEGDYSNLFCGDAAMPTDGFLAAVEGRSYDLVFSHMFLEHVQNPDQVHRNIFAILKPGGYAIHAYPTNNNLPLAMNSVLPERLSLSILRLVQPHRDLDGKLAKFPAYYKRCFAPSPRAKKYFEGYGYEVVQHLGYAGHGYYRRIPVLRSLEMVGRKVVVALQLPWIVFNVVVLRRPEASPSAS